MRREMHSAHTLVYTNCSCYWQDTRQWQLKEGSVLAQFEYVHHAGEDVVGRAAPSVAVEQEVASAAASVVRKQKSDVCWCSVCFSLFYLLIQHGTPAHGMVSPIFKIGLSLANPFWKHPPDMPSRWRLTITVHMSLALVIWKRLGFFKAPVRSCTRGEISASLNPEL